MAYVLGFFTADGNMIRGKRGNCYISFQITDSDILRKIKKALKSNHKIATRTRSRSKNQKDGYRLQIGSKEMFADLEKLGLTQNKSLTIKLPKVPKAYLSHFVRGYFDGDGHISMTAYHRSDTQSKNLRTVFSCGFTSGSKVFLKSLHAILREHAKVHGGSLFCSSAWRLNFSIRDARKIFGFMYPPNLSRYIFLERKRKKFNKILRTKEQSVIIVNYGRVV